MSAQIVATTTDTTIATAKRYKCRHIFLDGHRCGSPALRGEDFCYYHHTTRGGATLLRERRNHLDFELPPLEDRSSVLAAIAEVLQRIASGSLHAKTAGLLLYGLQIASLNLPKAGDAQHEDQPIEEVIADPRFGVLAPVAEVSEAAEPTSTPAEAPQTKPGAPSPTSGTCVPTPSAHPETAILPTLQASAANESAGKGPARLRARFQPCLRCPAGKGASAPVDSSIRVRIFPQLIKPSQDKFNRHRATKSPAIAGLFVKQQHCLRG
ncbi:hypothetical protein P8936_13920 [Edaphobacter paludis]|uniref:C3H1-type domain-containing protein n=1 Tax=Edaphobacter paludis TaxID=3035702 RepID=A0AAU7D502_9BACT